MDLYKVTEWKLKKRPYRLTTYFSFLYKSFHLLFGKHFGLLRITWFILRHSIYTCLSFLRVKEYLKLFPRFLPVSILLVFDDVSTQLDVSSSGAFGVLYFRSSQQFYCILQFRFLFHLIDLFLFFLSAVSIVLNRLKIISLKVIVGLVTLFSTCCS